MVVAQLVEWLLQKPEIHSSNPVFGKSYFLSRVGIEKMKITKQEAGNGPIFINEHF